MILNMNSPEQIPEEGVETISTKEAIANVLKVYAEETLVEEGVSDLYDIKIRAEETNNKIDTGVGYAKNDRMYASNHFIMYLVEKGGEKEANGIVGHTIYWYFENPDQVSKDEIHKDVLEILSEIKK